MSSALSFLFCIKSDADLNAVMPAPFRVKTLSLDWDVQIQKLAQNQRLIIFNRAPTSEISRTTQLTGEKLWPSKYTKARKKHLRRGASRFSIIKISLAKVTSLTHQRPILARRYYESVLITRWISVILVIERLRPSRLSTLPTKDPR